MEFLMLALFFASFSYEIEELGGSSLGVGLLYNNF